MLTGIGVVGFWCYPIDGGFLTIGGCFMALFGALLAALSTIVRRPLQSLAMVAGVVLAGFITFGLGPMSRYDVIRAYKTRQIRAQVAELAKRVPPTQLGASNP